MATITRSASSGGASAPPVRPQLNVSPIFDALCGTYVEGIRGERILNGGLWNLVCIGGEGNVGKSTLMNDIALRILSRYPSSVASTYDTEGSFQVGRMIYLAKKYPNLNDMDWYTGDGRYQLQSKLEIDGEDWNNQIKKYGLDKIKNKESRGTTPFLDKNGSMQKGKPVALKYFYPDIRLVDSLSEFQTGEQIEKANKHDIDDGAMNNFAMTDGRQKTLLLQEWTTGLPRTGQFLIFTAHVADQVQMNARTPPRKKLNYMRQGQKYKGVPSKTEFLTLHFWDIIKASNLYNSDRSGVYYPLKESSGSETKTDLMEVSFQGLRNKSGLSGTQISVIISQTYGVQWGLSCWHLMMKHQWGIEEVKRNSFEYVFYPGQTYMRTTIRDAINEDPIFTRALELGAEIMIGILYREEFPAEYRMKLKEIYDAVIEKGYDWDKILKTRGYWLFEEEVDQDTPVYLSGLDLIRIARGEYELPALKK